jgi:hypothetical protein
MNWKHLPRVTTHFILDYDMVVLKLFIYLFIYYHYYFCSCHHGASNNVIMTFQWTLYSID